MSGFDRGFRTLSDSEVTDFQQWAETCYRAGEPIPETWHPVVRARCEKMNRLAGFALTPTRPIT